MFAIVFETKSLLSKHIWLLIALTGALWGSLSPQALCKRAVYRKKIEM